MGKWMQVNGEAIYGSTPRAPYRHNSVCVVHGADGAVYAILLAEEGAEQPPAEILVPSIEPAPGAVIHMLGSEVPLVWEKSQFGMTVTIPGDLRQNPPCDHAWALRIPVVR